MSIFDEKDFSKIKSKRFKQLLDFIDENIWEKSTHYSKGAKPYWVYWSDKYCVDILKELNTETYYCSLSYIEKIEFIYNLITFVQKEYNHNLKNSTLMNIKSINNLTTKIIDSENLEFIEIDIYKYKLISKDISELTKNIENENWRKQINKFFSEYKENIVEKEKILSWFANHLEGEIRNTIESGMIFFDKNSINNLFHNLHNIYKHFNKDKKGKNLDDFNEWNKLNEKEKHEQMNQDMWFITYLLIEYERSK